MRCRLTIALFVAACNAAFMALPAHAGLFDDDEARNRIEGLRRDVTEQGKRLDAATAASWQTRSSRLKPISPSYEVRGRC